MESGDRQRRAGRCRCQAPEQRDSAAATPPPRGPVAAMGEPAQEDLLLAAAYVYDAQYNRNIPFETLPQAVRLYYLYNHWTMQAATYFFIFVDLALALFEEPAVYLLPFLVTSLVEVVCLLVFFGRLAHFAKVTPRDVFWKDTKNICIMITILVTLVDLIIYGALRISSIRSVRWSRPLRPIFLINFAESRQCLLFLPFMQTDRLKPGLALGKLKHEVSCHHEYTNKHHAYNANLWWVGFGLSSSCISSSTISGGSEGSGALVSTLWNSRPAAGGEQGLPTCSLAGLPQKAHSPAAVGQLFQVVYYIFSIVGMEIFQGKVQYFAGNSTVQHASYCGNPALKDSPFARAKYCKNNFNNLASSFVVLMELTVVNQWHDILFIFVAFILEAFFVEYSLEKSEVETAVEKKIQELGVGIQEEDLLDGKLIDNMETSDNDLAGEEGTMKKTKGLMFRIASKRYRTVDALLQRMFEAEIPPEEEGPSLDEIMNLSTDDTYPKNPTFDSAA
ncbi:hypothetical protein lerEdw1_019015 [Lerista edwardsae]|nr:hypothetical protein lerEdw1_019015 [Lerista edwardsae]